MGKGEGLMACEIIDFRCIFMNELIGNAVLTVFLFILLYFVIASKLRFGFDMTIFLLIPVSLFIGLIFTGFTAIYAFATLVIGILIAFTYQRAIGNR